MTINDTWKIVCVQNESNNHWLSHSTSHHKLSNCKRVGEDLLKWWHSKRHIERVTNDLGSTVAPSIYRHSDTLIYIRWQAFQDGYKLERILPWPGISLRYTTCTLVRVEWSGCSQVSCRESDYNDLGSVTASSLFFIQPSPFSFYFLNWFYFHKEELDSLFCGLSTICSYPWLRFYKIITDNQTISSVIKIDY